MDATKLRWIAVIVGLLVAGALVVLGHLTGQEWATFAGGVLGGGSASLAGMQGPK